MDTSLKASVRASHGGRPAVTICGGGNGGHALAVVASQHFDGDIDWLVGSEAKAELLRLAFPMASNRRGRSGRAPTACERSPPTLAR
jgi:hypothetical protein